MAGAHDLWGRLTGTGWELSPKLVCQKRAWMPIALVLHTEGRDSDWGVGANLRVFLCQQGPGACCGVEWCPA